MQRNLVEYIVREGNITLDFEVKGAFTEID